RTRAMKAARAAGVERSRSYCARKNARTRRPQGDSSHHQLTAEPWRRRRLIEPAPQLSKPTKVELGEARERLLGDPVLVTRHGRSPLAGSFDGSEAVYGPVIGILASRHLATSVAQAGNGRPHGMRQPTKPLTDLRHRSAFGSLEHSDQLRALCTGC